MTAQDKFYENMGYSEEQKALAVRMTDQIRVLLGAHAEMSKIHKTAVEKKILKPATAQTLSERLQTLAHLIDDIRDDLSDELNCD